MKAPVYEDPKSLKEAVEQILLEIPGRCGQDATEHAAKAHFLDRWYRLFPFGITTRKDIADVILVRVKARRGNETPDVWNVDLSKTKLKVI